MARCLDLWDDVTVGFRRAKGGRGLLLGLLAIATCLLLITASRAQAAIEIYASEDASYLGKIKRGSCTLRGKGEDRFFRAKGRTVEGGYRLKLTIDNWKGYRKEYRFRYGSSNPGEYHVYGIDGPFSNLYAPPGAAGLSAGGLGFSRGGKRMSVGFLPTPNQSFKEGVVLAGAMRCG